MRVLSPANEHNTMVERFPLWLVYETEAVIFDTASPVITRQTTENV